MTKLIGSNLIFFSGFLVLAGNFQVEGQTILVEATRLDGVTPRNDVVFNPTAAADSRDRPIANPVLSSEPLGDGRYRLTVADPRAAMISIRATAPGSVAQLDNLKPNGQTVQIAMPEQREDSVQPPPACFVTRHHGLRTLRYRCRWCPQHGYEYYWSR